MKSGRIAVCLFGISYEENYKHWGQGYRSIDYRSSIENYRKNIFYHLENYDVYYSTYNHSLIEQLKSDYQTKDGISIDTIPTTGISINSLLQRNRMISNLEQILNNNTYAWYIFTRFDLHLNFNLTELNISNEHINVLTTLELPNYICDNFYIIPHNKLDYFFQCIKRTDIKHINRHDVEFFGGVEHINLMRPESGFRTVGQLDAYTIVRGSSFYNNNQYQNLTRKRLQYMPLRRK